MARPLPTENVPVIPLAVSGPQDGITLSIESFHADAHRVTFYIHVNGPARPHGYRVQWYSWITDNGLPTLSVGDDQTMTWSESGSALLGGGVAYSRELLDVRGVVDFYTSELRAVGATLPISLSIPLIVDNNFFLPPLPVPSMVHITNTPAPPPLPTIPPSILHFAFSMNIPFDSRHNVVDVGHTVESYGVAFTLEQIDLTPSEMRLRLRYSTVEQITFLNFDDWAAGGRLDATVGNLGPIPLAGNIEDEESPTHGCHSPSSGDACYMSFLNPPFPDANPLDGKLTITAARQSPAHGPAYSTTPYGIWAFNFRIPVQK